jgi:dGTPase
MAIFSAVSTDSEPELVKKTTSAKAAVLAAPPAASTSPGRGLSTGDTTKAAMFRRLIAEGKLSDEQIAEAVPVYAAILETVETSFPGATERERFQESVRYLIDGLVSGLIEGTAASARASGAQDAESVRHLPARIVRFTDEAAATSKQLKSFLHRHVYSSNALAEDRRQSIERLGLLFEHLMAHPEDLPRGEEIEMESGAARPKALHRAVCDYIAGMTDGYFQRVYAVVLG